MNDERGLCADPDVQSSLAVGIYCELKEVRQTLQTYLPPSLEEQRTQTTLLDALQAEETTKSRWNILWKIVSFIAGNLPALLSLGMHVLGILTQGQTEVFVTASLVANVVLAMLVVCLHLRRKRSDRVGKSSGQSDASSRRR